MSNIEQDLAYLRNLTEQQLLVRLLTAGKDIGKYQDISPLGQPYGYTLGLAAAELIPKIFAEREVKAAEKKLLYLEYKLYPPFDWPGLAEDPSEGVTVDVEAGTWSFEGDTYLIGDILQRKCARGARQGPIGVYDRTNLEDLKNMLSVYGITIRESTADADD